MKKTNTISALIAFSVLFFSVLACNSFKSADTGNSSPKPTNSVETANTQTVNTAEPPKNNKTAVEKADFTVTAEQLDKEFTQKGVKEEALKKYASKNIAVSGRVSLISLEKKGTTQPWVTLFAPGVLHGVSCYFDDDNVEQLKQLKMDKMVKVQGFQDDFIVPEVSPRLEHCVVLEAN
ncbi:MAG TPA: hypothetical protein PKY59_05155 [Pyrinomonadaceae bacterium]|nr:hypothetical protein [Pyrinomonadaceae bacterium]